MLYAGEGPEAWRVRVDLIAPDRDGARVSPTGEALAIEDTSPDRSRSYSGETVAWAEIDREGRNAHGFRRRREPPLSARSLSRDR